MVPAEAAKVYLSPHHDDIAFSLGGFAAFRPGGELINVFTRSSYLAAEPLRLGADPAIVETVTALRTAEDVAFAAATGLARRDLGLPEPPVLGRKPWETVRVEDDIAASAGLIEVVLGLADALPEPRWLFCPLAIGPHVNHLAVRTLVLRNLTALERKYRIAFYEDLPYARSTTARRRAVRELRAATAPRTPIRAVWAMSASDQRRKLDLVGLYGSQHVSPPTTIEAFTPKAALPFGPHEAAWVLR
jgi:hypothetical protein